MANASKPPQGVVRATVEIEVPVEAIVAGWNDEETEKLAGGDNEAREELVAQALSRRDLWSGFDVVDEEVKLESAHA